MVATIPLHPSDRTASGAPLGGPLGPTVQLPGSTTLVPVIHGRRPVGAYVAVGDRVRYQPVVDVGQAVAALVLVFGAGMAVAALVARRRNPAIGAVTMGPGGWVSLKGVAAPALRSGERPRPWWAHLLRARRLVVER